MESVQGPDVVRVLERAGQGVVQAQVGPVDRLGLGGPALFQEQGTVGVPGGLHPAPGFVVGQVVVQFDGALQRGEGGGVVAPAVLQLAVEHGGGDGEDVGAGVVEQCAGAGHAVHRRPEQIAFGLRLRDPAGGREGDAAGVVQHRGRHAVQARVVRQRQGEDVRPAAEPDQDVHPHGQEGLEPVGHGRALHPQQRLGNGRLQAGRGVQGDLVPAQEHRAVDLEVVVVRAVEGVEVHRPRPCEALLVGGDRGLVVRHHAAVVAAQYFEV